MYPGITLAPAFSRQTTHLLCPSGTGAKFARAREWGVPVVNMGWLTAMAREGAVPAVHAFLVDVASDPAGADAQGRKNKEKGKEKETSEEMMQDITNSYDGQDSQPKQKPEGSFFLPPPPPARPSFGEAGPTLRLGPVDGPPARRSTDPGSRAPPASPSPPKRPTLSRSTTPLELIAQAVPVPTQSSSGGPSSSSSSAVRRAATFGAVGHAREGVAVGLARAHTSSSPARVPSSVSPSPLRRSRGPSVSPVHVPDHRTKALQESIVSLLGKRAATPEGDIAPGGAGKRGRPHRSKVCFLPSWPAPL